MQLKNDIILTKSYILKDEVLKRIKNINTFAAIALITACGLLLRFIFIEDAGGDYESFLSKWCMYLRENGGFFIVSYFEKENEKKLLYSLVVFAGILLMPTVILNSASCNTRKTFIINI